MRNLFSLIILCLFCLYCLFSISKTTLAEVPTMNEVVQAFDNLEKRLFVDENAFFVSYTSVVAENRLSKKKEDAYQSVNYVNSRKNGAWGVKAILADASKNLGKSEETKYIALNGKVIDWRGDSMHAVVAPFEYGRNMYQEWYVFRNIGIVPFRELARSNGIDFGKVVKHAKNEPSLEPIRSMFLPDCIKDNIEKYSIRQEVETIDGSPCWVVEWPKMDTIWLDTKLEGIVRKRIIYSSDGGNVKSSFHNMDFQEVKTGIFFPMKQDVVHYVYPEMGLSQSEWGKEHSHFVYKVDTIHFGTINDDLDKFFDVTLPVGSRVYDVNLDTEYRISDPNADPFAGPIELAWKLNRYRMIRVFCIVVGSIMIFLAVWLKLRKK